MHASKMGYDDFAPFNMKNEIFFTEGIACENGATSL